MEPNPDHPSPFATGRVRLDDGTERLLAFPLQRLAARLIDFVVASLATILVVAGLMHLLDAVWTCGACPFVETEPTQTQPAPAATTEPTAPTIAATSQEPGDCPDPPADVGDGPEPAQGPTTLEQVLVLVGSGVTMFFNASRQGWHDIAAASVVVRDPERCPPETAPRSGTLWTPHS